MFRAVHELYTNYSSEAAPQEGEAGFTVPARSGDAAESAGAEAGRAAFRLQLWHWPAVPNLTSTSASFSPSENLRESRVPEDFGIYREKCYG